VGAHNEIQQSRKLGSYLSSKRKQKEEDPELSEDEKEVIRAFKESNVKQRKDVLAHLQKNESQLREENEKFLYRYNYAKENPEAEQPVEYEETVDFKMIKNYTKTPKEFNDSIKHSIHHKAFTDKKLGEDFKKKLDEGLVGRGLGVRDQNLDQWEDNRDLSEIAHSDNPDRQSIYKAYMKYDAPQHKYDKEEEIRQRELEFIEAVKKDRQESSLKLNKSLQEYEDYKRNQQLRGDRKYEIVNDTPKPDNRLSKRDWLAKLWSGTVTPEEFGEYMTHSHYGQDKRGVDQIVYEQNKYPGYGPKKFITKEDEVRLGNEFLEQLRRAAIMDGRITEADSITDLAEDLEKLGTFMESKTYKNNVDMIYSYYHAVTAGEQVREYFFDHKQGVSLEDHLKAVAKTNPKAKLETYVDKDGFTVVKKTVQTEYKYNIDEILDNSPDDVRAILNGRIREMVETETRNIKGN
jgi:hypothetical protein